MKNVLLKIGDFAIKAGLTPKALRLYEQKGLIIPAFINDKGYRFFYEDQLNIIQEIKKLQSYGFTLKEIQIIGKDKPKNKSEHFKKLVNDQYQKSISELTLMKARTEALIRILKNLDKCENITTKLNKHDMEVYVEIKTMMQETCEDNGVLGLASWTVLNALRNGGANDESVSLLIDLMNKHFPLLEKNNIQMLEKSLINAVKNKKV